MHCDSQLPIAIVKNKAFNGNSQHVRLRHNVIKQLFKDRIISINYVKSERNLANPMMKLLGRKQIIERSKGMGLMLI